MSDHLYLIWSHKHGAWWAPERSGYVTRISQAGRYSHIEALELCGKSIPGTSTRLSALPNLPVREADTAAMLAHYWAEYPRTDEPWT